jgi:RimJ/RimL family protein N-acetyltransferase
MIETERLIIRPWRESDRADYLASCNDEAVTAHLGGPAKIEDIDAGLARIRKSQEENGFSFWAVERKSDGRFLGYCGLRVIADDVTPVKGEVEIGWRLRRDAWGQGYAADRLLHYPAK